jgi:hypothetical protein
MVMCIEETVAAFIILANEEREKFIAAPLWKDITAS